jgi:hypothetical protein
MDRNSKILFAFIIVLVISALVVLSLMTASKGIYKTMEPTDKFGLWLFIGLVSFAVVLYKYSKGIVGFMDKKLGDGNKSSSSYDTLPKKMPLGARPSDKNDVRRNDSEYFKRNDDLLN